MPYNAPELLLVGAAQNLVLDGLSLAWPGAKSAQQECTSDFPVDDIGNDSYHENDNW